ncbi:hypothetical protein [Silvanigrella aquatica]|uniref:Uncharacterized protein n=1 Tax=Silvanigrella aquatica TaxID=1915309 RepID=A0A1L4D2P0_9BACT|nr:hypothetical protein [Silvanigrella aquatica]APJ04464.1 hypothetical protein AXG55_11305 [Silvanigrella aquatica]
MLNANRADVFLGAHEINIKYIIKKELLDNIKIKKIAFIKQNKSLFKLCIRKNFPNAQKILDEYDRKIEVAIKNGEIDKILMKKDYNLK